MLSSSRAPRATLAAWGLGALLALSAWATWVALGADGSTARAGAGTMVAPAAAPPRETVQPSPREVARAAVATGAASVARAAVPARTDERALPVVPDGFALANGQLTAVRAPAVASVAIPPPVAVTLPAGVRPEDAVVSPTGMVAVMHSPAVPADAAPNPPRPASVSRSP